MILLKNMAQPSILDTEDKKGGLPKAAYILIGAVLILATSGFGYWYWGTGSSQPVRREKREYTASEVRDSAMMMLAYARFSGPEYKEQVLGKARLERFEMVNKDLYFSIPEVSEEEKEEILNRHFKDKTKIQYATEEDGIMALGSYKLRRSELQSLFFRTQLDNVKVDTEQMLSFPYQGITYGLSMRETHGFLSNDQVYGGRLNADTTFEKDGLVLVFANHGAMVAKPNEPSLQRFIAQLLSDESIANNREKKIQRLLDFVTNEIQYDFSEALSGGETLKRPNETLMTRSGDCSNKTILLASLLEQIGEDYLLLYCPKHITVAVPQGNFPNENKLDFKWEDKNWVIAETTTPGFQIGRSMVQDSVRLTSVEFVQRPKQRDVIFDSDTYMPVKFR